MQLAANSLQRSFRARLSLHSSPDRRSVNAYRRHVSQRPGLVGCPSFRTPPEKARDFACGSNHFGRGLPDFRYGGARSRQPSATACAGTKEEAGRDDGVRPRVNRLANFGSRCRRVLEGPAGSDQGQRQSKEARFFARARFCEIVEAGDCNMVME